MSQGRVIDLTDPNAIFQWLLQLRMVDVWIMILLNRADTEYHWDMGFIFDVEIMGSLRLTISI
jgi:hypothetical protein